MRNSGLLCLVVGPSGAGKDTLIAAAERTFSDRPGYVFPKREITRAADAGGEDHIAVTPEMFAQRKATGCYALSWEAHGLSYGIPASIDDALACGDTVIVNVSRTIIDAARADYLRLRVIFVTAPAGVLIERLVGRGRESTADVAERVARAGIVAPVGRDVVEISNDGSIADAIAAFLSALRVRSKA
jgi:ribose 1,5-bisphosphokinase